MRISFKLNDGIGLKKILFPVSLYTNPNLYIPENSF